MCVGHNLSFPGLPATWMAGVSSVKKAGSGQRARPGCPGSVVECGIIGVALGDAAIEGGRIERVQCGAGFEPRDEVRVGDEAARSEEHTAELQSLMRISYAVFCVT